MTDRVELYEYAAVEETGRATVVIDESVRADYRVSPRLLGKFCEHLGANIYHGMEAQLLFNPTFGRWSFTAPRSAANAPDGGIVAEAGRASIVQQAQSAAERFGLHDAALLVRHLEDGCAFGWVRLGGVEDVRTSPDAGPHTSRAQRVEILGTSPGRLGIAQRGFLPLHRTRGYPFRLIGRAYRPVNLTLSLSLVSGGQAGPPLAQAEVSLDDAWRTLQGVLEIPLDAEIDPEATYEFALLAPPGANLVLDRVLLYPDDHLGGSDPDVIRLLRQSGLPLLRWPGGNFVSGYHWRDGVGPGDARPTLPNPAWAGLEYNLFGTDEFIAFCRRVGCEPMICVNAGSGTPEEAAAWVEYCNGAPDTPMGRLRAENGHPEPYGVRLWEIGNEVHGDWQVGWTTAGGYVDRYRGFVRAIRAVDPTLEIVACGDQLLGLASEWNRRLIDECSGDLHTISDHALTGGPVYARTDPVELYQAFMGYAGTLHALYDPMLDRLRARGVRDPQIAMTELQLFAHFNGMPRPGQPLRPEWMPTPATISEALYLWTYLHAFVRLQGAVDILTHSATVNHGGGLRKARERVWANPVHYAHQLARPLAGGTPLKTVVACSAYSTRHSFAHIPALENVPVLDVLAVRDEEGRRLIVTLVNRGVDPIEVTVVAGERAAGRDAELVTLCGETMYDQNTLDRPARVAPRSERIPVVSGQARLSLPPYALARLTLDA